jgi:hypothetical protein
MILKERVLREFGDAGADTLSRYYRQLDYTAIWCARMAAGRYGIESVIPEGVEDLVIERSDKTELHQIKTRDESQGPWTTADVAPILCKLYNHRLAFTPKSCDFHFISDQVADTKTQPPSKKSYGPLYRLKYLLSVLQDKQVHTAEEASELAIFETFLLPQLCKIMADQHKEKLDENQARNLLRSTRIETGSAEMRTDCVSELASAFACLSPGTSAYSFQHIVQIYERLIFAIYRKIIASKTLAERRMLSADVLNCRAHVHGRVGSDLDYDSLPGDSLLQKKARVAGFHVSEMPVFERLRLSAEIRTKELQALGLSADRLVTQLIDLQWRSRDEICRERKITDAAGPEILRHVRNGLPEIVQASSLPASYVDPQFCIGLLWKETDLCTLRWDELGCKSNKA